MVEVGTVKLVIGQLHKVKNKIHQVYPNQAVTLQHVIDLLKATGPLPVCDNCDIEYYNTDLDECPTCGGELT